MMTMLLVFTLLASFAVFSLPVRAGPREAGFFASAPLVALAAVPVLGLLVGLLGNEAFWKVAFLGVTAILTYVGKSWSTENLWERRVKVARDILGRVLGAASQDLGWQAIADVALKAFLDHAGADPSIGKLSPDDIARVSQIIALGAKQAKGATNGSLRLMPGASS